MVTKREQWKKSILENKNKILLSLFLLIISLVLTYYSGIYVDNREAVAVPDLILGILPPVDLSFIFVYGFVLVIAIIFIYPLYYTPKKLHYVMGIVSLFVFIRSGFLVLTHLKAPLDAVLISTPLALITNTNDLFFSGHAGLPFLAFLMFDSKRMKIFMLAASIVLALTVLFMHVHYSIDVAAAYFITYGIYKLGDRLFGESSKIDR